MSDKTVIREIIADFHQRELPAFTRRMINLSCPENKIRCLTGIRRSGKTFTFYQLIADLLTQDIEKQRILYVNLDDERLLPFSPGEASAILNAYCEMFPSCKGKKVFIFLTKSKTYRIGKNSSAEFMIPRTCKSISPARHHNF